MRSRPGFAEVLARVNPRPFAALEEALLLRELVHGQVLSEREVARSTWAATRVFAPLARVNTEHATQLLDALASSPLSSRELHSWFQHYLNTPRAVRERTVAHPRLFIQTLQARDERRTDTRLWNLVRVRLAPMATEPPLRMKDHYRCFSNAIR